MAEWSVVFQREYETMLAGAPPSGGECLSVEPVSEPPAEASAGDVIHLEYAVRNSCNSVRYAGFLVEDMDTGEALASDTAMIGPGDTWSACADVTMPERDLRLRVTIVDFGTEPPGEWPPGGHKPMPAMRGVR